MPLSADREKGSHNGAPNYLFDTDAPDIIPALSHIRNAGGGVIAVLSAVTGRFYRSPGAVMTVSPDGTIVGSISSGCVEKDLALQALQVWSQGVARKVRYGQGSPYIDIKLSCGGGIEVDLVPVPYGSDFDSVITNIAARKTILLELINMPALMVRPKIRTVVFGDGPEAASFSHLASQAGYEVVIGQDTVSSSIDEPTAIVLFFHDHEKELNLLKWALKTKAFWIGAQGSDHAQARRIEELRLTGITSGSASRIKGPIGIIANTRDPRTLAISVLADIAAHAQ